MSLGAALEENITAFEMTFPDEAAAALVAQVGQLNLPSCLFLFVVVSCSLPCSSLDLSSSPDVCHVREREKQTNKERKRAIRHFEITFPDEAAAAFVAQVGLWFVSFFLWFRFSFSLSFFLSLSLSFPLSHFGEGDHIPR